MLMKTERIEVICLSCGKTWKGKANAKKWKCTQCNSTKVKPVSELENQNSTEIPENSTRKIENSSVKNQAENGKIENSTGIHVNSNMENQSSHEKNEIPHEKTDVKIDVKSEKVDELIDEILDEEGRKEEKIGFSWWFLLIPALVIALFWFLSGLRSRESDEADELGYGEYEEGYELPAYG